MIPVGCTVCRRKGAEHRVSPSIQTIISCLRYDPDRQEIGDVVTHCVAFLYRTCLAGIEGWLFKRLLEEKSTAEMLGKRWPLVIALAASFVEYTGPMIQAIMRNMMVAENNRANGRSQKLYGVPERWNAWNQEDWAKKTEIFHGHLCTFQRWYYDERIMANVRKWEVKLRIIQKPDNDFFVLTSPSQGPMLVTTVPLPEGTAEEDSDSDITTCSLLVCEPSDIDPSTLRI